MAQTLKIPNFNTLNLGELTKLDADAAIGVSTLSVNYSDNLAANNYLYIGRLGSESGEVKIVQSISDSDTIILTAPIVKNHSRFDDLQVIFGNKLKIYRAPNVDGTPPADAAYGSAIATVDIDMDDVQTVYEDSSGGDTYWYKFTYYNSTSLSETALADAVGVRGGGNRNYTSIAEIRDQAGLQTNRNITDTKIDRARRTAQGIVNSKLVGIYTLPFTAPIPDIISDCVNYMAAGLLLTKNYGPSNTMNTNRGTTMIEQVTNKQKTGWLDLLNTKDLVILDSSFAEAAIPGTGANFGGYPNNDTDDDIDTGGSSRKIRMGMVF